MELGIKKKAPIIIFFPFSNQRPKTKLDCVLLCWFIRQRRDTICRSSKAIKNSKGVDIFWFRFEPIKQKRTDFFFYFSHSHWRFSRFFLHTEFEIWNGEKKIIKYRWVSKTFWFPNIQINLIGIEKRNCAMKTSLIDIDPNYSAILIFHSPHRSNTMSRVEEKYRMAQWGQ